MLNNYLIFINKFRNILKTENSSFISPSNFFIKKLLDILLQNNLIQQYILMDNSKKVLVFLHKNRIKRLSNFLNEKKFYNFNDLQQYNKTVNNETILILSNSNGLTTNFEAKTGGMLLLEICLK